MAGEWLRYANQGATRNMPLDPRLVQAVGSFLPELGLAMEVFSGGQPAIGSGGARVGSTRHDHGNAADVFFLQNGRRLNWQNPQDLPLFREIVRRGKAAGITGFGAGEGYMQPGSMHIGFGSPGVWGAGGKSANAPKWLAEAYGVAPNGPAATPASVSDMYAAAVPAAPTAEAPRSVEAPADLTLGDVALQGLASMFSAENNRQQQLQAERAAATRARRQALFRDIGSLYG